ncbi:cytochrome P460 family protein [Limibaculum sp. M0105]|uniref:Cytochrome P460 family protein n=1 Tax=Thermohalobaculum xanthum TaxID=2753746 RepID=A0A8J7MAK2_9RHOB|nr:cytochrome P460 family protein [Thermohalobaculum xanthum]MBK0401320.1 cytochrome P460 family protein [Thermohalobaculum xanthum]
MRTRRNTLVALAVAAGISLPVTASVFAQVTDTPPTPAEIPLHVPAVDYRVEWVQLGSFSVLGENPADGAAEIHSVYTTREAVEAYLRDGEFPQGAVIVKDVWSTRTEELTTGTASYAGELEGRFVMVRDTEGTLGASPRVGDGWGWAFYPGDETNMTVTGDYEVDCLACHEPARDQGLLYLQGYPVLRR